jgi:hypothetical protein
MELKDRRAARATLPGWVPDEARTYLAHVAAGASIREIARGQGRHASTVLRQIRRFENRRDDPLVDEALAELGADTPGARNAPESEMTQSKIVDDDTLERESLRILRRLGEAGAVLAVAAELEKAVVVRETSDGRSVRTAVLERAVARAMALKEWIACAEPKARIARYEITPAGRAALKRRLAETPERAESPFDAGGFAEAHREWGERVVEEDGAPRAVRYNLGESPLTVLARRRDADGKPFLSDDLVAAGERLREDFELAQMAPRTTQNWERFLSGGARDTAPGKGPLNGPAAARQRVQDALTDLGPGLGDVALRTCCFLEGIETAEKRMGWSARSGKIVLRIALQRLCRHYDERADGWSPLVG